jgi:Family of unknown function (DUF6492)
MAGNNERLEIITCSYRPDLERCRRLCESVDRFVPRDVFHTLIVPRRDLPLFAGLENGRRRVLAVQDVVPGSVCQLPLSEKIWMDSAGWPIRGWVMQQLVKLSASRATASELLMFADSDLQFVRAFDTERVYSDGMLRLHRIPGAMEEGRHLHWHRRASKLLGKQADYFGSDYVGQLITWRRSNLVALQEHIERVSGKPWYTAVARSLDVSEYILYGSFVEHVLGEAANGHFYDTAELCHCCWFDYQATGLVEGSCQVEPEAMALLVQSNLNLTAAAESEVLQAALGRPTNAAMLSGA